jgi:2-polyprenyl-3-methyl-5-hydroxy-6-metoxy-1,4-benzoquinol methylase
MTKTAEHYYSYAIDPQGDSTANKVMALVGSEKQVLELGCGPGSLTRFMKEYGRCSIVAVEFDPDLAKLAEPFCEQMIVADLETLNVAAAFPEQRFDVIVAADVLEHLRDPWSCLKKIRSVLKPEGYLVVSVPNVTHNALIAQMLQGRFAYADKGLLDRTHLRFFARPDLT